MRLFVVSAIRAYREALAEALVARDGISIVGTASDTAEAARSILALSPPPDLVVVDVGTLEDRRDVGHLLDDAPWARVVAIGVPDGEGDALACAELGVLGLVTPEASLDDLVTVAKSVARGEMLCSPSIAAALVRRVAALARERSVSVHAAGLTAREREIVRLIEEGLSNKQIAQRLCIQLPTVKNHVHNILGKLGVHRRFEAAAAARGEAVRPSGD